MVLLALSAGALCAMLFAHGPGNLMATLFFFGCANAWV